MKRIKANKKYYHYKGDMYFIIREDKFSYYIIDSFMHECYKDWLDPLLEVEKNYDSEKLLVRFLIKEGAIL